MQNTWNPGTNDSAFSTNLFNEVYLFLICNNFAFVNSFTGHFPILFSGASSKKSVVRMGALERNPKQVCSDCYSNLFSVELPGRILAPVRGRREFFRSGVMSLHVIFLTWWYIWKWHYHTGHIAQRCSVFWENSMVKIGLQPMEFCPRARVMFLAKWHHFHCISGGQGFLLAVTR